jgi:hypothetical protein
MDALQKAIAAARESEATRLAAALNAQAEVVEALRFCKEALGEFASDQCPEGWRAIEAYQKAERALAALKGVKP